MAIYRGTNGHDTVTGLPHEANDFEGFGIGRDIVTGGERDDTFVLYADMTRDIIDGGKGHDLIDYSHSGVALTIDLNEPNFTGLVASATGWVAQLNSIEDVIGSSFSDHIYGSDDMNTLSGGAGDDTIFGYGYDDVLMGGDGNDTLDGGSSKDTLIGGVGADILRGGSNEDTASYVDSTAGVHVDLAANLGAGGSAAGDTYDSIEDLVGSALRDVLMGDDNANHLHGGDGNDYLFDRGGNDFVYGDDGDDTLIAGTGSDAFDGGEGIDTLSYENSANGVSAGLGGTIDGHAGGAGATEVTASGQYLAGTHDTIVAIENLTGSNHADFLFGTDDNNVLSGLGGDDFINAGRGDDTILPGSGSDTVYAGEGIDTISFANRAVGVEVHLDIIGGFQRSWDLTPTGDIVDGSVDKLHDVENITGSHNDDSLWGDDGRNVIDGGIGDDDLRGGGGTDTLIGGVGQDFLQGGLGRDQLIGGADADTFYFFDPAEGGDLIADYQTGVDSLKFSSQAFGFGLPGSQDIVLTESSRQLVEGTDPTARAAMPTFLFDTDSHVLWFDQDGTGSAAAVAMVALEGVSHLDHLIIG